MAGRIAYYGNIVKDGLILDLDAAKKDSYPGSGTVWSDISGFGNNGTLTNGPTFSSINGGSIVFDGANDYAIQSYNLVGSTDFSIEIWARNDYQRDPVNNNDLLALGGISGAGGSYLRYGVRSTANSSPGYVLFYAAGPNTFVGPSLPNDFAINDWHCYTFTRNTTSQIIYTDSTILGQATYNNTASLSINYNGIGRYANTYWNGLISVYRIYNRALSDTEVLQNYNATKGRYGL